MSLDRGQQDRSSAGLGRLVSGVEGRSNTVARVDTVGAVGQISQIDIGGAENDSVYNTRFQGRNIDSTPEVLTDGSATQEKLRDLLAPAYEADAGVMAAATSVVSNTNQIVINWLPSTAPPITVTFPANPTTDLVLTNTPATIAPQYVYGKAAEVRPAPPGPAVLLQSGIRMPLEIAGTVLGVSITHAGGETYSVVYALDGVATTISWAAGGDADATDVNAKAALDPPGLPTGTDVTIDATGELTLTFTAGVSASVVSGTGTGAAAVVTVVDSAAAALPVFCLILDEKATSPVDNGQAYQGEAVGPHPGAHVLTANQSGSDVWATRAPAVAPVFGGAVYVEADSGSADYGWLTTVASLTTILWAEATWIRVDPQDPTLAHVRF